MEGISNLSTSPVQPSGSPRRAGLTRVWPMFMLCAAQAVRGRQYRILIGLEVVTVSVIVSMAPKSLISTGFDRKTSRYRRTMAERWRPRRPSIASLGPLARIRPRRSGRWVPSGQSSDRSATRHPPSGPDRSSDGRLTPIVPLTRPDTTSSGGPRHWLARRRGAASRNAVRRGESQRGAAQREGMARQYRARFEREVNTSRARGPRNLSRRNHYLVLHVHIAN